MYCKINGDAYSCVESVNKKINALASLKDDGFTVYLCQLYLGCFYI